VLAVPAPGVRVIESSAVSDPRCRDTRDGFTEPINQLACNISSYSSLDSTLFSPLRSFVCCFDTRAPQRHPQALILMIF
jgi:hypothetical protein